LADNKLAVSTGTTDYLYGTTPAFTWGTENIAEGGGVPPRTGAVNLTFCHAMAKVTVNFTQVSGDNGVNISDAKIILHNAKTKASLVMADGTFTDYKNDAYTSTSNSSHTCMFYTLPQNLGGNTTASTDDLYFEIVASGNSYYVTLKDILNIAAGSKQTTIQDWEAGKHYVYTFSLYKKGVGFSASVLDWEDGGTTSGNITL
jgi:archaellin